MDLATLLKLLAVYSANKQLNGKLTHVPVEIVTPSPLPAVNPPTPVEDNQQTSTALVLVQQPPTEKDAPPFHDDATQIHAKATFSIPIRIAHILPDSAKQQLAKFEDYCGTKKHEVFEKIKFFNNFNYEKNQEIQYLSYSDKRKEEIVQKSKELKQDIEKAFRKMHHVCAETERYRAKITKLLNPQDYSLSSPFWPQPETVPKLWYDIFNLETIILQLFTPKLGIVSHYDEDKFVIRLKRLPDVEMIPRGFLALPDEYLPKENAAAIDSSTEDGVENKKQPYGLEPDTYSLDKEEQQMLIYYVFKYFEYKVGDLSRKVFYYSKTLKQKKWNSMGQDTAEIRDWQDRLTSALDDLQFATKQMEINRVTPEMINLYNAENAVHKLLPNSVLISKLVGSKNKRVTLFNPSESIQAQRKLSAAATATTDLAVDGGEKAITTAKVEPEREELDSPLEWDQNWSWDF